MAKINSVVMGKATGSIGNVTLKQLNGETIASQKRSGSSLLPTRAQVSRRVLLANLVNMYQLLNQDKGMEQAFPNRAKNVSNFNEFVAKNLAIANVSAIALTKTQAAANVIVPAPFMVTEGDLDSILNTKISALTSGDKGAITAIFGTGATATDWGDISALLIGMGAGYKNGDVVTIVGMEYPNTDGAVVKLHRVQWVIDTESEDTSMINSTNWVFFPIVSGNKCFSVGIVGRNENGKYRVSSSQFADGITETTPYTAQLNRKEEAEESYGYRDLPYLQDNSNPL